MLYCYCDFKFFPCNNVSEYGHGSNLSIEQGIVNNIDTEMESLKKFCSANIWIIKDVHKIINQI